MEMANHHKMRPEAEVEERLEELEKLREDLKTSILQEELERPQYSREDIVEWISRFNMATQTTRNIRDRSSIFFSTASMYLTTGWYLPITTKTTHRR